MTRAAVAILGISIVAIGCSVVQPARVDSTIRISEIHYHPSDEQGSAEYIEIANIGDARVDVSGWAVTGAGRVTLPDGTELGPGETLVLCKHQATCERLGGESLPRALVFDGKLRNKGETIRIEDPQHSIADEVAYDPDVPEIAGADGTGRSLHRADFAAAGGGEAWRAGSPSPGKVQDLPAGEAGSAAKP